MKRRVFCILACSILLLLPVSSAFAFPTSMAEVVDTILSPIGYLFLQISSFFLWLSGILLNYSINFSVIHFKDIVEKVGAIEGAWKVLRDVANIFFVIAILKVGFQNILGGKTENIGKVFENLVIAAIGINFSILIATTAIDVSNAFTLHFYRMTIDPKGEHLNEEITQGLEGGVTGKVMETLGIQSFFSDGSQATKGNKVGDTSSTTPSSGIGDTITSGLNTAWWVASPVTAAAYDAYFGKNSGKGFSYFLMGSAIILVIAFSFCVAAIMFAYRAVAFIVLLITAPFAFMGYVLPDFKKQQSDWRGTLEKECMWPPLYFLALYIGMQVLQSDQFKAAIGDPKGGGFVGLLAGNTSAAATIFNFIVVTTIFNGAMIVANKYQPEGLSAAKKYSTKLMNGYLGSALNASAYASRKTVGALGQKIGGSLATSDNKAVKWVGNSLVTDSKRSFDLRNIPGFEAGTAGLVSETSNQQVNLALGKPGEYFGYKPKTKEEKEKEQFNEKVKKYEEYKPTGTKYKETEGKINGNPKGETDREKAGSAKWLAKKQDTYAKALKALNADPKNDTLIKAFETAERELDEARFEHNENLTNLEKEGNKERVREIQANETNPEETGKLLKKFVYADDKDKEKIAAINGKIERALASDKTNEIEKIIKGVKADKDIDQKKVDAIKNEDLKKIKPEFLVNEKLLELLSLDQLKVIKDVLDRNEQETVVNYFRGDKTKNKSIANFFKGFDKAGKFNRDVANKANDWEGSELDTSQGNQGTQ